MGGNGHGARAARSPEAWPPVHEACRHCPSRSAMARVMARAPDSAQRNQQSVARSTPPASPSTRRCILIRSRIPSSAKPNQAVDRSASHGCSLGGRLHFDQFLTLRRHHVEVHLRVAVLDVRQVQHRCWANEPGTDRSDEATQWILRDGSLAAEFVESNRESDHAARDRCRARSAVGFEHVAIHRDSPTSPRARASTAPRTARPMSRAISCERPESERPLNPSRPWRFPPARGCIKYSAVTQPRDWPRKKSFTPSSTEAVQSTMVRPAR